MQLSAAGGGGVRLSFGGRNAPVLGFLPESSVQHSDDILGRGGSGIVRCGTYRPPGGPPVLVAVKTLADGASEREKKDFVREFQIAFAASQRCAGACYIYGCVHRGTALCLVMTRYALSLADVLEERRGADWSGFAVQEALPISLEIATALAQLHAEGIVVRDLKPATRMSSKAAISCRLLPSPAASAAEIR